MTGMTITPQYFTPRPGVTASVQLTADNAAELATYLNGIFATWNVATTDTGIQWLDSNYPGGRTLTASYGQFIIFTPAVYSGSGVNLGANADDPLAQAWNQAAPASPANFTLTAPPA
jgi:hypothetical protein